MKNISQDEEEWKGHPKGNTWQTHRDVRVNWVLLWTELSYPQIHVEDLTPHNTYTKRKKKRKERSEGKG